jgi:hypothetical protein
MLSVTERVSSTFVIVVTWGPDLEVFVRSWVILFGMFGRNLELMCFTLEPHREQPCLTYQISLDR